MKTPQKTKLVRQLLAATVLMSAAAGASAQTFNPATSSVQMFRWKWNDIAKECTNWLGPQGFGGVQVSPPQASANLNAWWDVYQPVNFQQLNSNMGSEAEFQAMVNTCHAAGVRIYADVILQHMAAGAGTATNGSTWNSSTLTYPHFSGQDFHPNCAIQDGDYGSPGNRGNVLNCRLVGLPDLKTESSYVRGQMTAYLNKLRNMGVDGIRIDTAKHLPASDIAAILAGLNKTTTSGEQMWITQEIIPDGNVNLSEYYGNGTINEFKFTYAMRDAFRVSNGSNLANIRTYMGTPGNWGGTWGFLPSDKATVFVNNWDTERNPGDSLNASNYTGGINDTQGTKRYDLANIFMLAWPYGHAQLHSGFRFTNKDAAPPSASPFDASGNPLINQQWDFIHRWTDISNLVKFRSYTNGTGVDNFTQGNSNQIAFNRGNKGFVAINNDGATWNGTFQTLLPSGTYCNIVQGKLNSSGTCTGGTVTVNASGQATLSIPGNGGTAIPAVVLQADQKGGPGDPPPCSVNVKFRVANANTIYGQNVHVVGNRSELGNWTPTVNNRLVIEGSGANVPWSKIFVLPAGASIQYKFMKSGAVADVWERNQPTASGNREATLPTTCNANVTLDAGNFAF
jgi:alpha-amylase